MGNDTIPRGDDKFNAWFKNFTEYVNEKTQGTNPEWKHIPKEWITRLNKAYDAWSKAYEVCQRPHTEVETEDKNTARVASEKEARLLKKLFIDFAPEVSNASRRAMRVPVRGNSRVRGSAPEGIAQIIADTSVMRQVTFRYKNSGSSGRGKPRGVHGLEFRCAILDKPPESIEELTRIEFYTASPFTFEFTEGDRGKKLYFCGRWESNTGKKGPWGVIEMVIIP